MLRARVGGDGRVCRCLLTHPLPSLRSRGSFQVSSMPALIALSLIRCGGGLSSKSRKVLPLRLSALLWGAVVPVRALQAVRRVLPRPALLRRCLVKQCEAQPILMQPRRLPQLLQRRQRLGYPPPLGHPVQ